MEGGTWRGLRALGGWSGMEDLTQELYSPDFFLANHGRAAIAMEGGTWKEL